MIKPIRIIKENIPATDVAKYYLEIEFSKLFKDSDSKFTNKIVTTIQNLPENKVWTLLEAISFTYHLNGVFYNIGRENYNWNEEVWHVKDLILTGMDSKTNKVIFSEEINGDALKFKAYLLNYFEKHTTEDPEGLMSYKPSNKKVVFEKLLMKEQGGKIHMLDGSHRLVEMLLAGTEEVTAHVGHPLTKQAEEHPISKMGPSLFILLTILFKRGDPKEREAVLTILKELIKLSIDGKEEIQKYWIDRMRDEEIKEAGIKILENS